MAYLRTNVFAPGHLDPYDSYGLIACQLIEGLVQRGIDVNVIARGKSDLPTTPVLVRQVAQRPIRPMFGGALLGYPTGFRQYGEMAALGPRLAITMFESSRLPPSWIQPLNSVDAVIVPSQFCLETFKASGVTRPIFVVPLGVDPVYRPVERRRQAWVRPDGSVVVPKLTFLSFLDRGLRKGGFYAIQAFVEAFGEDPNYHLVLKSRATDQKIRFTNANITVIQRDLSPGELAQLYGKCDVLINPTMGEGFGLIPREFAATGGIALTTGWSGTADDLDQWGVPLPFQLVQADWLGNRTLEKLGQAGLLGQWAQPDIQGVARLLRQIADAPDEFRNAARQKAALVNQLYSWPRFVDQVLELLERFYGVKRDRAA